MIFGSRAGCILPDKNLCDHKCETQGRPELRFQANFLGHMPINESTQLTIFIELKLTK
jgi:hypothetical protein